jgi:hypothetical protein
MPGDALWPQFACDRKATEMPVSIEEFKTAFASQPSTDGAGDLERKVDGALKALNHAVERIPPGHTAADGFGKVLVELVTRSKAVRDRADSTRTADLEQVARQAMTVLDRVQAILVSPPTPRDAPATPTDTHGADRKPELQRTGGTGTPGAPGGPPGTGSPPQTPPTVNVVITVVDIETNAAINGAIVELTGRPAKPANNGTASFALPPGDYEYRVTLDGYRPANGRIHVKGDADVQKQVQLQSLARGIDIDGDVQNARGLHAAFEKEAQPASKAKLARALLKIADDVDKRLSQAHKDSAGVPILSGKIQFDPNAKGTLAEIAPFGARDQWKAAGAALSLEVRVYSAQGKEEKQPLKSAIVRLKYEQGGEDSTVTDGDGWVGWKLPPGKYVCEASHPRFSRAELTVELTGTAKSLEFVLRPEREGTAGPAADVTLQITVADHWFNTPVKDAQVTVGRASKKANADGRVDFTVRPGT